MQAPTLTGGFENPPVQSAHAFRSIMEATARPGTIQDIAGAQPPAPLSVAAGSLLLTLCDTDTPVFLAAGADCDDVRAWLAFHTGAPLVGPSHCMFAVGGWADLMPLNAYPVGTPEYPDRSATLIVESTELSMSGAVLSGPGIKTQTEFCVPDLEAFQRNQALFPLGLDFIFTCGAQLAAVPRSTRAVHHAGEAAAQKGNV